MNNVSKTAGLGLGLISMMLLSSCGGGLAGMGGGGGLSSECGGDFGADSAASKLEAFMAATSEFTATAAELEASLLSTCRDMGSTLGLSEQQMAGQDGDSAVAAACNAVSEKLRVDIGALRAEASLELVIVAQPPVCTVSVDAYAGCVGECDVNVDPGEVDVQCEGGEMRGGCSGSCSGSCSVQASAQCAGSCEGTCSAGCQGTCNGACDGECSSRGANGQCNGTCSGSCQGTCEGGCSGSCEGSCIVEASASCEGECRGSCDVEFTQPTCTGTMRPPSASAECQASCDARMDAQASCEPGQLSVTLNIEAGVNETADRVVQALRAGLPQILALGAKLGRLAESGGRVASAMVDLPGAVASLTLQAGACATQGLAGFASATANVSVSVEVSASVSGSATAG